MGKKNIVAHAVVTQLVIWDDEQFLEHLTRVNGRMLPNSSSTLVKSPRNNIPAPQQPLNPYYCIGFAAGALGGRLRALDHCRRAKPSSGPTQESLCVRGDFSLK